MGSMRMAVALLMIGCAGGNSGDDDLDIPLPDRRGEDCTMDHAPSFDVEISAGQPDWYETDQGVRCLPTVQIRAVNVVDEDGDLTRYKMDVWFDSVVDGRVLTEGTQSRVESRVPGDDCSVDGLQSIGMNLGIAGGGTSSPAFDTETEFGVVVQDDGGNLSYEGVPKVASVVTPPAVTDDSECD